MSTSRGPERSARTAAHAGSLERRARRVLVGLLALASATAGILAVEAARGGEAPRPWQRALGGLGLTGSTGAAWSFFTYDPRVEPCCENELAPLPGLPCPSPEHGAGVVDLPPLRSDASDP